MAAGPARRGVTAAELLVALTIAGVVLALLAGIAVRLQRVFGDVAEATALEGRLREATSVLAIDLRSLAPASGDIRDARDTSLEFRGTIASAVVCDTTASGLILAPSTQTGPTVASFAEPVAAGDTAWLLAPADSTDVWLPLAIASVGSAAGGQCGRGGPRLAGQGIATGRTVVGVSRSALAASPIGLPVRITRPVRYSVYRASDAQWYLGQRDWNRATQRFNTIQPVAGPLLSAALGGLVFAYLNGSGSVIPSPVVDRASVAMIRVDVRGETRSIARALGPPGLAAPPRDSASVVVALRGSR